MIINKDDYGEWILACEQAELEGDLERLEWLRENPGRVDDDDDELDFDTVVDMLHKALQDAETDTEGGDFARGRASALRYALSLMDAVVDSDPIDRNGEV